MPRYELHVVCDLCKADHRMGMSVFLPAGPSEICSAHEAFGAPLPEPVKKILTYQYKCPAKRQMTKPLSARHVLLDPLGD